MCQTRWRVSGYNGAFPKQMPLKTSPSLLLSELPDYVRAGIDYLKIPGREHPERLMGDITRFYRRMLDEVSAGSNGAVLDRYIPELEELKRRWITERGRRDRHRVLHSQIGKTLDAIEQGHI